MDKSKILLIPGGGLSKMCRICLTKDVTLASLNSFSAQLSGPIIDSLSSCAAVRVKKYDGMPLFICKQCYLQMLEVDKFQKKAKASEQTLMMYLRKLSSCSVPRIHCDGGVQNESYSKKKVIDCSTVKKSNVSTKLKSNNISKRSVQQVSQQNLNVSTLSVNTVSPACTAVTGQQTLVSSVNIENNIIDNVIVINDDDEVEISIEQDTHRSVIDRRPLSSKNDSNLDIRTAANFDNGSGSNKGTDSSIVNTVPSNIYSPMNDEDDDDMVLTIDESEPEQSRSDTENLSKNIGQQTAATVENQNKTQNVSTKLEKPTGKNKVRLDQIEFFEERQLNLKYRRKHFECNICKAQFCGVMEIMRHKKEHPNMKGFKCDSCGCLFGKWSKLCKHKRLYEGKCKKQAARHNPKKQVTRQYPKKQVTRQYQPRKKIYKCTVCVVDFKYLKDLKEHNLTAHPSCTVCEKIFTDQVGLNSHECEAQLIHECDICNKRFKKSTALNNHRTTHGIKEGEKIFVCDVCRKRFATLISLVEHKRTHEKLD